jgi:2',3'-cyclic-nucleotide 2'-phosphodiesterase (5'-nucleotidase family)
LDFINIYSLNDFHGALFKDGLVPGLAKIGHFLQDEKEKYPKQTIILSAGDMFQGTYVSFKTRGRIVVEAMNIIGFDAMTIGNHEFDWGASYLASYQDGKEKNSEARFPFLGANIRLKENGKMAPWLKPYKIHKCGEIKIGIIGIISSTLEDSILKSMIADYEFTDEIEAIKTYTKYLRVDEKCDLIIVSFHGDDDLINQEIASLEGIYLVDVLFNAHTHRFYAKEVGRANIPLAVIQSGDKGKYIGKVRIELKDKKIIDISAENIPTFNLSEDSAAINALFTKYQDIVDEAKTELGKLGSEVNRNEVVTWAANLLRAYGDADLGVINLGGIRKNSFPILKDELLTYDDVFQMNPFENTLVSLELKGSELLELKNLDHDLYFSSNFDFWTYSLDGKALIEDKIYKIVTIDYVFQKEYYPFHKGKNSKYNSLILRDLLVCDIKKTIQENGKWLLK